MTCLVVDDDPVARALTARFVEQHEALTLVGTCEDAVAAMNTLARMRAEGAPVELVFLDVEMPEMTGIELADALGSGPGETQPQIVLITSKEEYARDAFDVAVTDYIVKPPTYGRFAKAVERALAQKPQPEPASDTQDAGSLFVKSEGRLVRLDLGQTPWIEAQKDYVLFHTASGEILVHTTMKALEERLPAPFIRVHRSYFVRTDRIEDIEDSSLVIGRKMIPIGATYRVALLDSLNAL